MLTTLGCHEFLTSFKFLAVMWLPPVVVVVAFVLLSKYFCWLRFLFFFCLLPTSSNRAQFLQSSQQICCLPFLGKLFCVFGGFQFFGACSFNGIAIMPLLYKRLNDIGNAQANTQKVFALMGRIL